MKKKDGLGQVWFICILFVIAGLIGLVWSIATLIPYHQQGVDLYETNFEEIPIHSHVHGEAFAVLGYCAEKYNTNMGVRVASVSDAVYCLIPVYKADEEEYYILLQVEADKESDYDSLIQATQSYILGEAEDINCDPIYFSGLLDNASSEIYGYAKQWFKDTGYYSTNAEIEKYVLPYCVNTTKADLAALHVIPFISLVMFAIGLFFIIALVKDKIAPRKLKMTSMTLKGKEYPIHDFDNVDQLLRNDKRAAAVIELSKITGMTYDEALEIIEKWPIYYY